VPSILLTLAACGGAADTAGPATGSPPASSAAGASPVVDPGDGGNYSPAIDPAAFGGPVDNPYLPLLPGARWVYEGSSDGQDERIEVVVTGDRRTVAGVETYVVRDTVYLAGELIEDTYDWYAQDDEGNVWYFGEAVEDYENGVVVSRAGSWEAGVDGALPGIVMPAAPELGRAYRQEFLAGQAEDLFEIIATDDTISGPTGDYTDVVSTRDWTPLDPDVIEEKHYAPNIGKVQEEKVAGAEALVALVEFTPGS